jgi:hypothetical protein
MGRSWMNAAAAVPLLALPVLGRAQDEQPEVLVHLGEGRTRQTQSPDHKGHGIFTRDGWIDTGEIRYGIRYTACYDESHGEAAGILEGYIGMPEPAACNWYHSGFLQVAINGADIGTTRIGDMYVSETGQRGSITMLWNAPQGAVRLRFLALPDDDRLFCEIGLDPAVEVTDVRLSLKCYPSFFTSHYNRAGWRRVTTPTHEAEQDSELQLQPADDWWLAFTDDVFDPAKEADSAGGCAVLFDPDQILGGAVQLGSYAVTGSLSVRPDQRSVRLIFSDFNKRPNGPALKSLRESAGESLTALREMDFAPLVIGSFDLAKRSAAAAAELKKVTDPADFPTRFEALNRQLAALLAEARNARAEGKPIPVETEKAILGAVEAYEKLDWELKFHVLLSD